MITYLTLELNLLSLCPALLKHVNSSKAWLQLRSPTILFSLHSLPAPISAARAWWGNSKLAQYNTLSTLRYYYFEYGNKLTQGHQVVKRHQIGDRYQLVCPFKNKITSNKYYYELKRKSVSICGKWLRAISVWKQWRRFKPVKAVFSLSPFHIWHCKQTLHHWNNTETLNNEIN